MANKKNTKSNKSVGGTKPKKEVLSVTQEVFNLNKDFFEGAGVVVGDKVEFTKELKKTLKMPEPKVGANTKPTAVKCPAVFLKGEEYVRTYQKGQEEAAQEFALKNPDYKVVSPEDVHSIVVTWRENETKKDSNTGRVEDTGRLVTRSETFSEDTHGENWMSQARRLANDGQRRSCVAKLIKSV